MHAAFVASRKRFGLQQLSKLDHSFGGPPWFSRSMLDADQWVLNSMDFINTQKTKTDENFTVIQSHLNVQIGVGHGVLLADSSQINTVRTPTAP